MVCAGTRTPARASARCLELVITDDLQEQLEDGSRNVFSDATARPRVLLALAVLTGSRAEGPGCAKADRPFCPWTSASPIPDSRKPATADPAATWPWPICWLRPGPRSRRARCKLFKWKAITFGAQRAVDACAFTAGAGRRHHRERRHRALHEHRAADLLQLRHGGRLELPERRLWTRRSGRWSPTAPALPATTKHLTSINYGGSAHWFAKPHVAFTFDGAVL